MTIRIVTDSTCDLPPDTLGELGIEVIPLYINVGSREYIDGVDVSRQDFYRDLPDYPEHPTTATPSQESFYTVYKRLASQGASQIISIHLSESLSATVNVARSAAREFNQVPVHIVDAQQISIGTGFQVEMAAKLAAEGQSLDQILGSLADLAERSFLAAKLNSLEYLRRSGRMNRFMAGLASVLQVVPILTMDQGIPGSERVRTDSKAMARLMEMFREQMPLEQIAVVHSNAKEAATAFAEQVHKEFGIRPKHLANITPVIGVHVGPGAVGFAGVRKA